ncbi:MAG TPA: carbon storage regulator [Pirellulales bacterium]|jgi:carbon storage regulator|nr:carbon storage regulator [Pirellulales bacterium]
MLVLSRKQGQSIVIDERTVVTVLQIGQGRVQIGIVAPPRVPVYRQEIHDRIKAEQRLLEAGNTAASASQTGETLITIELTSA